MARVTEMLGLLMRELVGLESEVETWRTCIDSLKPLLPGAEAKAFPSSLGFPRSLPGG